MPKHPYLKFFTADWLANAKLSRVSAAARGVWIDVLCLMSVCEERGVLVTAGEPWTVEQTAAALRGDSTENRALLGELLAAGIAGRREGDGAIFSARMVRDDGLSQSRAASGHLGGVAQAKSKQTRKQNASKTVAIALVSSSNSETKRRKGKPFSAEDCARIYDAYPVKKKPRVAKEKIASALARIAARKPPPDDPVEWLLGIVRVYAKSDAGNLGQYTPHCSSWMNADSFDEDPASWRRPAQDTQSPSRVRGSSYKNVPIVRPDA